MNGWRRASVLGIALGAVVLSGSRNAPIVVEQRPSQGVYSAGQKEAYMTTEQLDYVRPGFHITVNSVTIPADLRPLVDLSFADDLGQPLDRLGKVTPGALSVSQVLAYYDPATRNYVAYTTRVQTAAPPSTMVGAKATQSSADSGGTWTDLAVGHSTYKFKTALPAGYDQTKTTTLAIYATRDLITPGASTKNYFANVEYDFRPDGQTVVDKWDILSNQACNTCHNPLSAHGGSRQDVKLCATCHNPATIAGTPNIDPDTGNTIDLKVMIHKIHYGVNLPSVKAGTPYEIIGFSQGVNDFSTVVFPQDIRNCTTCHRADLGNTNSATWYTFPSSSTCGSCHDDVNFTTGVNHVAGAQPDSACANCHQPQGSAEWDAGITTAHTVPLKSKQLPGLNSKIVSVANTAPGQKPTVKFQLTNGDGTAVTPAALGSNLNLLMGGPTADYGAGQNPPAQPFRENASGAAFDGTTATYTFTNAIPANATGTWTFSIEARRTINLNPSPKQGPTSVTEGAFNPVAYAAVTDSQPSSRRQVVDIALCNKCHDKLALHGGQRFNPQECVICHNPNGDDSGRRPADKGLAESIDFKRMIHRIHTGEELLTDIEPEGNQVDCTANPETFGCFTIYGFGTPPSVNNFNDVRFPGDRRDCQTCHAGETEEVLDPPPAGLLPTITQRDWYSPQQHYAAACLGCHDGEAAAAHALSMTVTFPNGKAAEACATCHGPDAEFAVDKVHAR